MKAHIDLKHQETMMKRYRSPALLLVSICATLALTGVCIAEDYWTPKGPPLTERARMRTMNEIEPRSIIDSLPFTVTNSGSFVLVKDLVCPTNSNGITIPVDDVTIDLNGFALIGTPVSLSGILVSGTRERIHVKNGNVRNWGKGGIKANSAYNSRFEDLLLHSNGFTTPDAALYVGPNSIISGCTALTNNGTGIYSGNGTKVVNCTTRGNVGYGLIAGANCIISGSTAGNNKFSGFYVGKNCIISHCNAIENANHGFYGGWNSAISHCTSATNKQNGFRVSRGSVISASSALENADGFYVYHGSVVKDCSSYRNSSDGIHAWASAIIKDCTSLENGGDGIDAAAGSRVTGCLTRDNAVTGAAGIRAAANCHIKDNTCMDNYYGIYEAGGAIISDNIAVGNVRGIYTAGAGVSVITRNVARGNSTADYNQGSDAYGPTISSAGLITNVNPWANFDL